MSEDARKYASELRDIAGMVAQTEDGPLRWKQYRLAAIADYLSAYQSEAPALAGLEHAWLVEENASGIIHWIALEADSWPRTKVRRMGRRAERLSEDDLELEEYQTPVRRVKDANEALRFARKEDAEAFIALFDRFLLCPVATEHEWPSPAPSLPLADREAIAREVRRFNPYFKDSDLAVADAILALSDSLPPSPVGEGSKGNAVLSEALADEQAISARLRMALRKISTLRPPGDVERCTNARKLVEHMEAIALSVLPPTPAPVRGE